MSVASLQLEAVGSDPQFRHLSSIAGIAVDLRYATPDNFVGRDLYSPIDCAWLHRDAAAALEQAVAWLAAHRPDHHLLVLDALRPQRVQQQLWDALQGTELLGYIAEPSRGSIHSFGMALDITIVGPDGQELDMGTGFDDLSERSHPALELALLESGEITQEQVAHRRLLRDAMFQAGFFGINSEWWHFDCGDRVLVRQTYTRVL
ncbi:MULTISPECIES: M15 family metallopeptidase [unclassified Janthinobacterium]|uniref:M15 family metallopeptidase n=1 Tax=unclassified Janthinobacterium TaxID=2610881 RepID=UPI000D5D04A4|nr:MULTISPECIES: M15 family metallopeptidase [unclassified Janthinobacterium]PVX33697.1 D-alanyl-D-alanine dipeptidase [Janthinobacterium sp. 78]QYG05301.1 M15 family metallopeptidase [Janthinobacterium sp. PAMC25594]